MSRESSTCLVLLFEIDKPPQEHDWKHSEYLPSRIVRLNVDRHEVGPLMLQLLRFLELPDVSVVHVLEDTADTQRQIDQLYSDFEVTYNVSVEWYIEEIQVDDLLNDDATDGPSDPSYILTVYGPSQLNAEQVADPTREPPIAVLVLDYLDSRHLAGIIQGLRNLHLMPLYWQLLPWSEESYVRLKTHQTEFLQGVNQCLACLPDHKDDPLACRGCAMRHLRPFASHLLASGIAALGLDEEEQVYGELAEEEPEEDADEEDEDSGEGPETPAN